MKNKICKNCRKEKRLTEFHKARENRDGLCCICKLCRNLLKRQYYKRFPWIFVLQRINARCKNPKTKDYKNYGGRGIKCLITIEEIKGLWFRDKACLMKKPSIDRKDNNGNYIYKNCRFIEYSQNSKKTRRVRRILQYNNKDILVASFQILMDAQRQLNIANANICAVLNGNVENKEYIWNQILGF